MGHLDILLVRAFQAYRQGLCSRPVRSPMTSLDFGSLKFLGTLGWVPLRARLELRALCSVCDEALVAARKDRLADSLRYCQQAQEALLLLEEKSWPAFLLGNSKFEAAAAYLDFRNDDLEQVYRRLDRAMDADLELEKAGLPIMQLHRIQQGHNMARMSFRLGQRGDAIKLAGALMAYIEGRADGLPYHHSWRSRGLKAVPRYLLRSMLHQISGETIGSIVAGSVLNDEWRLLVSAACLCSGLGGAVSPQLQLALWSQSDRLRGDQVGYLQQLERFFELGIDSCQSLWHAMLVELVDFCLDLDTPNSLKIRDAILRDSTKLGGFSITLSDRLVNARQNA